MDFTVYAFWTAQLGQQYSDTVFYQSMEKPNTSPYRLPVPNADAEIVSLCAGLRRLVVLTASGSVLSGVNSAWDTKWYTFNSTQKFTSCALLDASHVLLAGPDMHGTLLNLEFETNTVENVQFSASSDTPLFVSVYRGIGAVYTSSKVVVAPVRDWLSPVGREYPVVLSTIIGFALGNTDRSLFAAVSDGLLRFNGGENQWEKYFSASLGGVVAPNLEF